MHTYANKVKMEPIKEQLSNLVGDRETSLVSGREVDTELSEGLLSVLAHLSRRAAWGGGPSFTPAFWLLLSLRSHTRLSIVACHLLLSHKAALPVSCILARFAFLSQSPRLTCWVASQQVVKSRAAGSPTSFLFHNAIGAGIVLLFAVTLFCSLQGVAVLTPLASGY